MANGRTLAFTVPEELFQRVKEYLAWYERTYHRRLTQKEFVLGLIEDELEKMSGAMETERQAGTAAGCGDGGAAPRRMAKTMTPRGFFVCKGGMPAACRIR